MKTNAASEHPISAHEVAVQLAERVLTANLNEADTRHQVIDKVLHDVLVWPRELTRTESFIDPGFSDYQLVRADGTPVLLLEAKREGKYFELPQSGGDLVEPRYVQAKTLMTDADVAKAMRQVHDYCIDAGCQFAGITNGKQWIFFRTFQPGQDWRSLHAFVISTTKYFADRYTDAVNKLGHRAISDQGSLGQLLGIQPLENRPVFYPKQGIIAYESAVNANVYSPILRPIVNRYFENLNELDDEFMSFCYVSDTKYEAAFRNARARVKDSLTPFLEEYRIQQIEDSDDGGAFTKRIKKSLREQRGSDVIVLFGGKGVGKSTFLRRLLFFQPPSYLKKHSVPSLVSLLEVADVKEQLYKAIWQKVVDDLDLDKVLRQDRPALLELFSDEFERARKQELFGFPEEGERFNAELNRLLQGWLADRKYCARRLAQRWARMHRGVVVVIDNTDQLSTAMQEFCFTVAHEISKELGCLTIISMREERFYSSSIHGTLDAFHNSGFHISSPSATEVFRKRLRYVVRLLRKKDTREDLLGISASKDVAERVLRLFETLANEFELSQSHLADFLAACAHGNIRKALDLFRGFMLSRYTNVTEMTSVTHYWTISVHQVLKPIMIPYRFFYTEKESHVPNIYQVRSRKNGSHLTALRILDMLAQGDPMNPPYLPLARVASQFVEALNMKEDFELNIGMLLEQGLVEANNRIDEYRPDVDRVRITNYGRYMYESMSKFFTYIELVSVDSAIFDESTSNSLVVLSNQEYDLWSGGLIDKERRMRRVQKRLEKAERFIQYLVKEEEREFGLYSLTDRKKVMPSIVEAFAAEKVTVLKSAAKQSKRTD